MLKIEYCSNKGWGYRSIWGPRERFFLQDMVFKSQSQTERTQLREETRGVCLKEEKVVQHGCNTDCHRLFVSHIVNLKKQTLGFCVQLCGGCFLACMEPQVPSPAHKTGGGERRLGSYVYSSITQDQTWRWVLSGMSRKLSPAPKSTLPLPPIFLRDFLNKGMLPSRQK